MEPNSSRRRLVAVAFLACLFGMPALAQQPASAAGGKMADRTPAERKLDSSLMFAARAFAPTPGRIPLALQPHVQSFIDANVAADQTIVVVIKADVSPDLVAMLRVAGAYDLSEFPQYGTITARVPITALSAIALRTDVRAIRQPERYRLNHRFLPPEQRGAMPSAAVRAAINTGAVVWEGITAHQADQAILTGIDGTGVKVCVLSDGVDSLLDRQASGDLPATVDVLPGRGGMGDGGTAMLEIIHDMAPGAALGFATSNGGTAQFADNISGLQAVGCNIIVDGVTYVGEGAFQDDVVALAVNGVTDVGAIYFSSAGDFGNLTHAASGTYEADFVASAAAVPAAIQAAEGQPVVLHSFGANPYATLTAPAQYVTIEWSDPLGGSGNDYDIFVMDSTGTNILGLPGFNGQFGTQDPVDTAACPVCQFPAGSRIYVVLYNGLPRALRLDTNGGRLPNGTTGGTFGHNAAASALSVASIDVRPVGTAAFTGGTTVHVDTTSADGPRRIFYTPAGFEITGGNLLITTNGGTVLPKVDITAADCGSTATPAPYSPFCGTAASAATAASIAALIKSTDPSLTKAQVTTALMSALIDIEVAGVDRDSGSGIVMAPAAVRAVLTPLGIAKVFIPSTIASGGTSTLTLSVTNPNSIALQGVAFTDTYPLQVTNAAVPNASVSGPAGCAATLAAPAGGGTFGVTLATIPAGATCTFTVAVTSLAGGVYPDATGALTTPVGLNTAAASATLTVGTSTVPVLVSAVARKVHGAAGTFDLPLSQVPTNPTTEPRLGPTHQLVFTFDRPINAAVATVNEGTATRGHTDLQRQRRDRRSLQRAGYSVRGHFAHQCRVDGWNQRWRRLGARRVPFRRREPDSRGDVQRYGPDQYATRRSR